MLDYIATDVSVNVCGKCGRGVILTNEAAYMCDHQLSRINGIISGNGDKLLPKWQAVVDHYDLRPLPDQNALDKGHGPWPTDKVFYK